jgi:glycosyltransferase involved in cell wall biosynthesis
VRILTFLHSFEPGGVERVALRLVRRWRALGVDAPLFLGRADGPLRGEVADGLAFDVPRQPRWGTAWWETLWMIAKLPGQVRRTRPDLVFCAGSTYTVVAVSLKLVLGRSCPPIVAKISNDLTRADLPPIARHAWTTWLRLQAKYIDRWIVMEESILPDVDAQLGPVDRVVVPDPAIDEAQIVASGGTSFGMAGKIRFLAVGRLVHQKDFSLMLRAFALGRGSDDTLTLMGDGPLRLELGSLAVSLGIGEQVTFAGHVPDAARRMRDYDVVLMSSRYEGVPAALIEALAAGRRIVASDCGPGVRALLDAGIGTIVPRGDPVLFAAAMRGEPSRPLDRAACRERARRFTLEGAAELYLVSMQDVLERSRRTGPDLIEPMPYAEHAS